MMLVTNSVSKCGGWLLGLCLLWAPACGGGAPKSAADTERIGVVTSGDDVAAKPADISKAVAAT